LIDYFASWIIFSGFLTRYFISFIIIMMIILLLVLVGPRCRRS